MIKKIGFEIGGSLAEFKLDLEAKGLIIELGAIERTR